MIKVIQSTQENKWIENTNMKDGASYYRFDITGEKQTVNGFGGAFNEIGWDALHNASESIREEILDALFSEEGTAFTVGRIPIGASDFALSWYSLCDEPEDYELTSFSIERDKNCLIPYIKEAQKRQPDMWFHASPWSPPVWMKTPQRYNGGTINKDSRTLESYANYFKKFVEAYDEEGIHVSRLFPQNEPSFEMNYPTSIFYGKDMAGFIKNYLGPLFEAKGIDTELWWVLAVLHTMPMATERGWNIPTIILRILPCWIRKPGSISKALAISGVGNIPLHVQGRAGRILN